MAGKIYGNWEVKFMRGHIKLFTLPLDLDRANQFGIMDTKVNMSLPNPDKIDVHSPRREIFTQAE